MRIYSANQVNQVYVATAVTDAVPSAEGQIKVVNSNGSLYFQHFGKGGLTRSDLIDLDKVLWASVTPASAMAVKAKQYTITPTNNKIVAGEDYLLRLTFQNPIGISPYNAPLIKYGVAHAGSTDVSALCKQLVISILQNVGRDSSKLIKVGIIKADSSAPTFVNSVAAAKALSATNYTAVVLEEVPQEWIRGLKSDKLYEFDVTAVAEDEDDEWAAVTTADGTSYPNGKQAADYEYFHMGERGDQYRMAGFPDYIPTEYMVAPANKYDYINIHFAYVGDNESVQKSEKDITILAPTTSNNSNLGTVAGDIVTALTTAGITVKGAPAAQSAPQGQS